MLIYNLLLNWKLAVTNAVNKMFIAEEAMYVSYSSVYTVDTLRMYTGLMPSKTGQPGCLKMQILEGDRVKISAVSRKMPFVLHLHCKERLERSEEESDTIPRRNNSYEATVTSSIKCKTVDADWAGGLYRWQIRKWFCLPVWRRNHKLVQSKASNCRSIIY